MHPRIRISYGLVSRNYGLELNNASFCQESLSTFFTKHGQYSSRGLESSACGARGRALRQPRLGGSNRKKLREAIG